MKNPSINYLVKEEAEKMFAVSGQVNPWRVARNLHLSEEIVMLHLTKLGYTEKRTGSFILKGERDKATVKKPNIFEDIGISNFKVSNDMDLPSQDFIQQEKKEIDYSGYRVNELRSIAAGKGIKGAFFMKRSELIKKIKSKLS